jgi:hypothetical protein
MELSDFFSRRGTLGPPERLRRKDISLSAEQIAFVEMNKTSSVSAGVREYGRND